LSVVKYKPVLSAEVSGYHSVQWMFR